MQQVELQGLPTTQNFICYSGKITFAQLGRNAETMNRNTLLTIPKAMHLECHIDAGFAGSFKTDPLKDATIDKSTRSGQLSTLKADYIPLSASL